MSTTYNANAGSQNGSAWTNPTNAWNGSTANYAQYDLPANAGKDTSNYLIATAWDGVPGTGTQIETVEIGIYTDIENNTNNDIYIKPVIGGSTDGDEYDTNSSTTAGWRYINITSDSQAPTWNWSDIQNLDVKVYGRNGSVWKASWVRVYSIVVRVTAAHAQFDQYKFRWRNDDGSESTATWAASEDTAYTTTNFVATKRLRIGIDNANDIDGTGDTYRLEYNSGSGWNVIPTISGSPANPVYIKSSANITDGTSTTAQLTAPGGKDTGDFVAGKIHDEDDTTDSITVTNGTYTEVEFNIGFNDVDEETTYQFRINGLNYYTQTTADITLLNGITFTTDQNKFRWYNNDGSESEASAAADENTDYTTIESSTEKRVRFQIENTTNTIGADTFQIEYNDGTGWDTIPTVSGGELNSNISSDNFNDNNLDTGIWDENELQVTGTNSETGQQLVQSCSSTSDSQIASLSQGYTYPSTFGITGDFDVSVKLVDYDSVNASSTIFLLNSYAQQILLGIYPEDGTGLRMVTPQGGGSVSLPSLPFWLRLKNVSGTITGYYSTNGTSWSLITSGTMSGPYGILLMGTNASESSGPQTVDINYTNATDQMDTANTWTDISYAYVSDDNRAYASATHPLSSYLTPSSKLRFDTNDNSTSSGTITKVEIVIEGYLATGIVTFNSVSSKYYVRPVFDGTTPGSNYNDGDTFGYYSGTFSDETDYLDITNDGDGPGAGFWTWDDITNLDVDAWVYDSNSNNTSRLYIDKLSLRVTYENITYSASSTTWDDFTNNPASEVNPVYIKNSTYITDGGTTTARLAAPAGKTTSNFDEGEVKDTGDTTSSISIGRQGYTEVEWNLAFNTVSEATSYDFRVAGLDNYTIDNATISLLTTTSSGIPTGYAFYTRSGGITQEHIIYTENTGMNKFLPVAYSGTTVGYIALYPTASGHANETDFRVRIDGVTYSGLSEV